MDKEVANEVLKRLDLLAEKLGIGVQQIFPLYVRQAYINSILAWVFIIVTTVTTYLVVSYAMNHYDYNPSGEGGKRPKNPYSIKQEGHEGVWNTIVCACIVLLFVSIIVLLWTGFDWLNPHYWAFKDVLTIIGKK